MKRVDRDDRPGIRNDNVRDFSEEKRDSGDKQCDFEINHTVHWITCFDGKVVDENPRLYRSTDAFNWGKWHIEQGVLVTSLAKKRGNTSYDLALDKKVSRKRRRTYRIKC